MNNFWRNKKQIFGFCLILLISVLGIFVLDTKQAEASLCNPLWGSDFDAGKCLMITSIDISAVIIQAFGSGLNIILNLLTSILNWGDFIEADIVKIGWGITRDLVNMFFVFILLIIAIATILKVETFGMKAVLPKLIILALLINFTLVIAGAVIDFSQILTDFFITQAGGTEFQTNIMNATQAMKTVALNTNIPVADGLKNMSEVFIGAILTVVFLLTTLFVLGAYVLFLIIRIVAIWFLLIMAPLAWMAYVLPNTKQHFEKWWSNFIKWVFFAPASAFFIFLAIFSYKSLLTQGIQNNLNSGDYSQLLPSFTKPDVLLQYLLVIGILFGGLIVAQSMGIAGAKGAVGLGKSIGKKFSGVGATQKWWKARKAVGEDEAKERRKRKMALGRVGQIRQTLRENIRPTAKGRAEARARKNTAVNTEAQRMAKTMDLNDIRKIAGKRVPLTAAGRMQKLAAQSFLSSPGTTTYRQARSRTTTTRPGTWKYNRLTNLANRTRRTVARKRARGQFRRYT